MRDFTLEERKQIKSVREKSYKKRHTYTVKAKPKYIEFSYSKKPVLIGYFIHLIPRNGKTLIIRNQYRSKSTAEFVAKKLDGAKIKFIGARIKGK